MDRIYELVKCDRITIKETYNYLFYLLGKYKKIFLTLFLVGVVAAIFNTMFIGFGYKYLLDSNIDMFNNAEDFNSIAENGYFDYLYMVTVVSSFVISILTYMATFNIYKSEWDIKGVKRSTFYYVKKIIAMNFITFFVLFGIVYFLLVLFVFLIFLASNLSVVFMFFVPILVIFIIFYISIMLIGLSYEYVINDFSFLESLSLTSRVTKKSKLSFFSFTFFLGLPCMIVVFIFYLILGQMINYLGNNLGLMIGLSGTYLEQFNSQFSTQVTYPISVIVMVLGQFAVIVKYMNIKYKKGIDIFPEEFMVETDDTENVVSQSKYEPSYEQEVIENNNMEKSSEYSDSVYHNQEISNEEMTMDEICNIDEEENN
ncbi:MAG: hypothetical protein ACK5LV_00450 [Lachnospirales bacterium]